MLASIVFGLAFLTPSAPVPKELRVSKPVDIKAVAATFDAMLPETAAKAIADLCDAGNIETAVQIFAFLTDRRAAKIIDELPDSVATQIIGKLILRKKPMPLIRVGN